MIVHIRTYSRLAAGALLALVVACNSDDEEPAASESTVAPPAATAAVQATTQATAQAQTVIVKSGERGSEYFFEPKDLSIPAGKLTVTLENSGPERPHTWAVKNKNGQGDLGRIERTAVGSTGTAEFTFTEAGTYEIYCTLPGHADRGQRGTLTVTGAGT